MPVSSQIIINSMVTGSIYVLIAIGLTMVYKVFKFANFSHAELVTFGAYMAYIINVSLGENIIYGLIIAFLLTGFLAIATDRLVFFKLRNKGSDVISMMIASIGIGFVLRQSIQEVWSPQLRWYDFEGNTYDILGGSITELQTYIILSSILLIFMLHFLFTGTRLGKAMRAVSDNPQLAMASGIDTEKILLWVWFIGGGLAGIGGVFRGADTMLVPLLGWEILLPAFAVVILGGIGSFYGAIIAAYILGFAENFGVMMLSDLSISTGYRPAIAFIILILVLILRPTGIMGKKEG
ncbi:MAG: branched-chain amino acid ABC transporter permease [Candidatus Methanoperedens sp.]|nr:branched-chain amino acid ABC transporter permease [Candidatus Methanoperedens sp.]CAG1000183.1 High-affinity branched-chain amino acid transport system permease protein LivH [Methanosarcinales archaeon]